MKGNQNKKGIQNAQKIGRAGPQLRAKMPGERTFHPLTDGKFYFKLTLTDAKLLGSSVDHH